MRTVFLDCETTGPDPARDEVLEIGILGDDRATLLDALVRSVRYPS
jgi:oligoribonuclease (3'-5' exoribonuclease)